MNIGLQPAAWHDIFVAVATAAAALLGLFFVAISLHPAEVDRHPFLRNRARVNLQALAALMTVSLAVLIPSQSNQWLGAEFLLVTFVYLFLALRGMLSARGKAGSIPRDVAFRFGAINAGMLFQIVAGISLLAGGGPGLYLEAPVLLLAMPAATFNAWTVIYGPELRSAGQSDSAPVTSDVRNPAPR